MTTAAQGLVCRDGACTTQYWDCFVRDGIEENCHAHPPLTSVRPDNAWIARTAVDLQVDRPSGKRGDAPAEAFVDHRLIERESMTGRTAT